MADRRIRAMIESDLEQVLSWRNHPDIRERMFTRQEISQLEHQAWFAGLQRDPLRCALLYEEDGLSLGVITLRRLQGMSVAEWGFYRDPSAPKGTGFSMGVLALNHAFKSLRLHKVYGEVIGSNAASIGFHRKLGFCQEGLLRDHFETDGCYEDVLCFGMLAEEWESIKEQNL
ncbi:UDP-4-amino-4,6-dideoxy-N-acetyl-beta-L-altrosamine N-acetyltransferase [Castellaniella denitrificans]|uniref:UDP-4-amino-4, 6-dideoxy-N-acetyl-beta-L-altrosamine N-acetyltransferase n=1 Tax=Castellaniella denitrificans TaxID=56119 RepID=A0ABT4M285_9BURK|nr:UDP-4-amino-4,6-dideoxy-N-acetyl-beta-L-altrosamine N-acetyltransferase [Castellaniella denitrificans]MCZ4328560.1 UDP-4-amino-4,6-dideoxy-N-acetyl-beta-L-altrosamine N-acetyltransferase [Castellaniella denitrificans]